MPRKSSPSGAIHAVIGSDDADVKSTGAELAARLAPADAGEFGVETIDGAADNAEQACSALHSAIDALLTVPFLGGDKLVWLKSANCFADTVTGRAARVLEAAEQLSELLKKGLPPGIIFLVTAPSIDKRRSFCRTLQKVGSVTVRDRVDTNKPGWEESAIQLAAEKAAELGLQLRGEALQLLALLTGGDRRQLTMELEKIDLYLGPDERAVPPELVRAMVPLSRSGVVFELGNALAARDMRRSQQLVRQLLEQGESAIGILLAAVVPTVRNLLLIKDLMVRHRLSRLSSYRALESALNRLPEEATAHLPRKKDGGINFFGLSIAAAHAERFSLPELRNLMQACVEANRKLVTTQLDPEVVLSRLVAGAGRPNPGGEKISTSIRTTNRRL